MLVVSLWRHRPDGDFPLAGVRYLIGELKLGANGPQFTPTSGGRLDLGDCFYAPQLLVTDERVLVWEWAKEDGRPAADVLAAGWSGSLTFARVLAVCGTGRRSAAWCRSWSGCAPLPGSAVEPGRPLPGPAFEVGVAPGVGTAELVLVNGDAETVVGTWAATPDTTTRALVDGSMIEIEDGAGCR